MVGLFGPWCRVINRELIRILRIDAEHRNQPSIGDQWYAHWVVGCLCVWCGSHIAGLVGSRRLWTLGPANSSVCIHLGCVVIRHASWVACICTESCIDGLAVLMGKMWKSIFHCGLYWDYRQW